MHCMLYLAINESGEFSQPNPSKGFPRYQKAFSFNSDCARHFSDGVTSKVVHRNRLGNRDLSDTWPSIFYYSRAVLANT